MTILPQGSSVTWTGTLDTLTCDGVTLGQRWVDGSCNPNRRQEKDVNRPSRKITPEEGALQSSVVGDRDKQARDGVGLLFWGAM